MFISSIFFLFDYFISNLSQIYLNLFLKKILKKNNIIYNYNILII